MNQILLIRVVPLHFDLWPVRKNVNLINSLQNAAKEVPQADVGVYEHDTNEGDSKCITSRQYSSRYIGFPYVLEFI